MQLLTEQQVNFFETVGYIALPGLMRDEIGWITEEFEAIFRDRPEKHDFKQRSCVVPFIDQRERLCTLLDHPAIAGVAASLLGPDFNYVAGDGNYYVGDTGWHSDGFHTVGRFLKIAFYLDPVTRDTGCLRVIPGSHRADSPERWEACNAARSEELWGIPQHEVPAIALEATPGDIVAFNHNIMHASFGGSAQRRMFTLNLCKRCETAEEIADLKMYIDWHARFWIDHMHSDIMRSTASSQRRVHLEQAIELEVDMPRLHQLARKEMAEASRGS